MGRYIDWSNITNRYSKATNLGAQEVSSAYISGVEAEIDARLAHRYAVPFASSIGGAPAIITDVATDFAFYRMAMLQLEDKQATRLWDSIEGRLTALGSGTLAIVVSGQPLPSIVGVGAWGTHMGYGNVTGLDCVENYGVGAAEALALESTRWP